jgi:hypothetical protein
MYKKRIAKKMRGKEKKKKQAGMYKCEGEGGKPCATPSQAV